MATYYGSTAASSVSNPPVCIADGVAGTPSLWVWSATATTTDVKTANYFTDAKKLGIKQNDMLIGTNRASTSAPKGYFGVFGAVTTSGAALQSAVSSTAA
jgi:hypothetical protein